MNFSGYVHRIIFFVGFCSMERNCDVEGLEGQESKTKLGYPEWTSCMYLLIKKKPQHVVNPPVK
ncbi:hypothetical protein D3C74_40330 [compost metagenome]